MTKDQLLKKCEQLESLNRELASEIHSTNALLIAIGFPQGLESLKEVAQDVLDGDQSLA